MYTSTSGTTKIILADHSEVTLLQGAQLTVEKTFPADTRDVFLKGDALFKVSKSKEHPFIVHGDGYETKVLGTVFKVSQSEKTFRVDLFEGKVLVYKTGQSESPVPLAARQSFTNYGISKASAVSATKDTEAVPSKTRSASLTFSECPINDAVLVIEKTYGIRLQYGEELRNTKITITVPNATADEFIQTLAVQLNLNTKKNNDSSFQLEK
ncbi:FecR family protein [Chryseobacterium sp. SL1]|uniref:FecR family protein n=1 Tax=Chryseobacterium sp. SL1 TaxID=2995159 RepID=UPI002272501C|nr:FecR family protein [Chryseobacterium sp. SL1]MCY1662594.1 FecR family protein [Chryseobacterium sp. SL1]